MFLTYLCIYCRSWHSTQHTQKTLNLVSFEELIEAAGKHGGQKRLSFEALQWGPPKHLGGVLRAVYT